MHFSESLIYGTCLSLALMLVLWVFQRKLQDAGLVDFGWAACIALLAVGYAVTGTGTHPQRILAGVIGGFWGGRLALHLLVDRIVAKGEDGRYQHLRDHWGRHADLHFLWFFAAQGFLAVAFSLPFFVISRMSQADLTPVQIAGLALFVAAMLGEAISDRQLARFRTTPGNRGRTCRSGLWKYSRHPNYFFEWLIWCAVALLAWPAAHGAWTLLAPAMMYLFITRITGVPHTEAQALRSRGDDYRRYQQQTNAFFPGPPRSGPTS